MSGNVSAALLGGIKDNYITNGDAASLLVARRANSGGRWLVFSHVGATPAATDALIFTWIPEFEDRPISLISARCTVGGAGSAVKFALWRHDLATGRPIGFPPIGQNTGLATTVANTWQDLTVPNIRMSSPGGWWMGWVFTGTLPAMVSSNQGGNAALAMSWPTGARAVVPRAALSIAQPFANNLMAFDATGAPLVESAAISPALYVEYA